MHPWERIFWTRNLSLALAALLGLASWLLPPKWAGAALALTPLAAGCALLGLWAAWKWHRRLGLARSERALFPPREGNRVAFWIDGEAVLGRIATSMAEAKNRIWIAAAFIDPDLPLPGRPGQRLLAFLAERARAGVDVRLLCWRLSEQRHSDRIWGGGQVFHDHPLNRQRLAQLGAPLKVRWDDFVAGCHHQKIVCIDSRVGFCGGVNLVPEVLDGPGHRDRLIVRPWHDLAAEVEGPLVGDLEGNFIQRWNGARHPNPWPDGKTAGPLTYPAQASGYGCPAGGRARVQLVRTLPARHYRCELDVPGAGLGRPSLRRSGEASLLEAYRELIEGARESLYIENQYFFFEIGAFKLGMLPPRFRVRRPDGRWEHALVRALRDATARGVCLWIVLPGRPQFRRTQRAGLASLAGANEERLGLFSLAVGQRSLICPHYLQEIYVHSKLLVADGRRVCVGSGNLSFQSLHRDSEAALLIDDALAAKRLLARLWDEHLGPQGAGLAGAAAPEALSLWKERAQANARRVLAGEPLFGRVLPVAAARHGEPLAQRFASDGNH